MQSIEAGMKFMNKKFLLFIILMVSSCGVLKAPEYASLIRTIFVGAEDIIVDQKFYDNQQFSFAKISLGRSKTAIITLGFVEEDILQWFSSSQSAIYTQNGKIVSLVDFPNDMRLSSASKIEFRKTINQSNVINFNLKDPQGFFTQDSYLKFEKYEDIQYLQKNLNAELYSETIRTNGLSWNFVNLYWIDPISGRVLRSEQSVHPRLPRINITYYYKYLD